MGKHSTGSIARSTAPHEMILINPLIFYDEMLPLVAFFLQPQVG
jgi:hypothetical protein